MYIKITLIVDMTSEHRKTNEVMDIDNSLHYT